MAKIIQYSLLIVNFVQILQLTFGENEINFQQRFTTKCNELCEIKSDEGVAEVKPRKFFVYFFGLFFFIEFFTAENMTQKNERNKLARDVAKLIVSL